VAFEDRRTHRTPRFREHACESRPRDPHPFRRFLLVQTLDVHEAQGLETIQSQGGGYQFPHGNPTGLEDLGFEAFEDAARNNGTGHCLLQTILNI